MPGIGEFFRELGRRPGLAISASFLVVIFIGAGFLSLPQATVARERIPFIDALFMSTSATCVTGLVVTDPESISRYGQTVILLLIQAGGLGIMTWAVLFSVILRRRLGIAQQAVVLESLGIEHPGILKKTLIFMLVFTFVVEAIGFLVILPHMLQKVGNTGDALFVSSFHAVSAFCNAGFSTFNDNLQGFRGSILITMTITSLVILGGLGLPVSFNLWHGFISLLQGRAGRKIALHTQLALITSAALIGLGFGLFYLFERDHSLKDLPIREQILASYFHSVVPRTAGFSTIDIATISEPSFILLMFLMFIGGSPGSTAGGIKTTTFAVLMATLYAFCRGSTEVECFGRTVAKIVVQKALTIALLGILVVLVACLILSSTERVPLEVVVFEVFSAFDTVGLSAGLTPGLSLTGKIVIMVTMFLGRIGPLTLAFALGKAAAEPGIRFPEEHVAVG
ncbi:MAG TPA: TrkH family potassium uptake protein [Candidatus Hypogeohydataceae bacterium YC38]